MKADQVLTAHHDVLRGLLHELEQTTDEQTAERRSLLDRLVVELGIHTQIEDELFYPAMRAVSPLLAAAHAEHRQIDDQLAAVMRLALDSPQLPAEIRLLTATLQHHALEEEQGMFVQAQALGDERLEHLGDRMQARQQQLADSQPMQAVLWVKRQTLRRL